ncbi:hybrid sensor histidine kinase/response regulator [Halobaculum rubrum]|uniref:hybrid sensor histidine kinase/response regulator n=1 Tax=Halobaculum rubrum TaxID=2872158 RepID=UPI001CA44CBD|nr:PAS domain S-box protein [Halobaculum rubrum]QZY00937.1 PAS domain S-box protein [Halobaculum rubrum]
MADTHEPIRVLHVDDEPAFGELVTTFLEREHDRIEVRGVTDAEAGLDVLADHDVDCVVSDHDMPGKNGIEFLRAVREEYPDLPFLLFTGKGSEEVASDAISAGVTDYIQKGGGTDQYALLANRIVNAVEASQSRRMLTERTRRLETLIGNLPGIVYRCCNEPTWPMETVDGEVEVLTGYTAAELESDRVEWGSEVIHPDDREAMWDAVQEGLAADGAFEVTYRIRTRDGEMKWMWERGRGVYADDGSVEALEGFITDITDRKEREDRLTQTTARLEALFEESPDMIDIHDAEGNVLDANPQFFAETGYTEEAVTSMKVWDIDRTLDPTTVREIWEDMEVGDRREFEGEYTRRDGSTFPVTVHTRRLDLSGADRFLVSSRDVSDRERRDRKLEQLRERSRALNYTRTVAETADLATDAADEIIGAELSSVHLLNDAGDRLEPTSVADSVEAAFDEIPTYDRSAAPGTRAHFAWEAFRADGPTHVRSVSDTDRIAEETPAESVLFHPIGDYGLFIISSTNADAFTETDVLLVEILANYLEAAFDRVAREKTLRERQDRLELLHEATQDLIRADSRQAIADRIVEAAEGILGFSVTVVRFFDADSGELAPVAESDAVADVIPERQPFTADSGSLNWASFEADEVRVYDDIEADTGAVDTGTGLRSLMLLPLGTHGTVSVGETAPDAFDSTDEFLARILTTAAETALDEHERERRLRESRDELRRQNERLEEFVSVVSHDLRNPLNVATGRLDLARGDCDSEHFDAVDRAHDRMEALIEDLLALAREDDTATDLAPIDPAATVRECWANVETGESELVVEADRPILADERRLRQLFENLVRNAVEHGGDSVTVTVGDLDDGFFLEDDGVGIPASRRDSVFEAGYSTSDKGTGFGLRIVKQVVVAHGWEIRATEGTDGGARFEVTGVASVDE